MSTRCHIAVYENATDTKPAALLYRHSDGYPDGIHGVVTVLTNFLAKFMKDRGWDSEYLPAQLLHYMIQNGLEHRKAWSKMWITKHKRELTKAKRKGDVKCVDYHQRCIQNEEERMQENDFHGYGVCTETHGDIEYFYRIDPSGVHCFEWDMRDGHLGPKLTTAEEAKAILDGKVPEKFQEKVKAAG